MGILGSVSTFSVVLFVGLAPLSAAGCGWYNEQEQDALCAEMYASIDPGHVISLPRPAQTALEEKGYTFTTVNKNGYACGIGSANEVGYRAEASSPLSGQPCDVQIAWNFQLDPTRIELSLADSEKIEPEETADEVEEVISARAFEAKHC